MGPSRALPPRVLTPAIPTTLLAIMAMGCWCGVRVRGQPSHTLCDDFTPMWSDRETVCTTRSTATVCEINIRPYASSDNGGSSKSGKTDGSVSCGQWCALQTANVSGLVSPLVCVGAWDDLSSSSPCTRQTPLTCSQTGTRHYICQCQRPTLAPSALPTPSPTPSPTWAPPTGIPSTAQPITTLPPNTTAAPPSSPPSQTVPTLQQSGAPSTSTSQAPAVPTVPTPPSSAPAPSFTDPTTSILPTSSAPTPSALASSTSDDSSSSGVSVEVIYGVVAAVAILLLLVVAVLRRRSQRAIIRVNTQPSSSVILTNPTFHGSTRGTPSPLRPDTNAGAPVSLNSKVAGTSGELADYATLNPVYGATVELPAQAESTYSALDRKDRVPREVMSEVDQHAPLYSSPAPCVPEWADSNAFC
eukprot:m.243303 g.243303  ORF g.243303 m.243303 type:complete len:415 (+) comp26356_c0_seq6:67-1311(+)